MLLTFVLLTWMLVIGLLVGSPAVECGVGNVPLAPGGRPGKLALFANDDRK